MVDGLISYTPRDKAFAHALSAALRRAGIAMYETSGAATVPGSSLKGALRTQLARSVVVGLVPPRAARTSWVIAEIEAAKARGTVVIPVVLSHHQTPPDLLRLFASSDIVRGRRDDHEDVAMAIIQRLRQASAPIAPRPTDHEDARSAADAILAEGARHSLRGLTIHDLMEEGRRA